VKHVFSLSPISAPLGNTCLILSRLEIRPDLEVATDEIRAARIDPVLLDVRHDAS
jgi:hypothetical protein